MPIFPIKYPAKLKSRKVLKFDLIYPFRFRSQGLKYKSYE